MTAWVPKAWMLNDRIYVKSPYSNKEYEIDPENGLPFLPTGLRWEHTEDSVRGLAYRFSYLKIVKDVPVIKRIKFLWWEKEYSGTEPVVLHQTLLSTNDGEASNFSRAIFALHSYETKAEIE